MSRKDSIGRGRRTTFTLTTALGGATAAAILGMGTANADTPFPDPYTPPDAYTTLFGAMGDQGAANHALDVSLLDRIGPDQYAAFYNDIATFEHAPFEHGLENLINAIDPSAFYEQTSAGIVGTIADSGGAYLVPDDALGYLATGLDYGLLTPTGLNYVLTPLIDILLGEPPASAGAEAGASAAASVSDPYVDTYAPGDAYTTLFGAMGDQGVANHALDVSLMDRIGDSQYAAFFNDVATFESMPYEHGLENLINAIDPSAFYEQVSTGITGTIADSGGAYLVPDDFLGYLATGLDYGLLTPTGLNFVLTPLIDILLGEAPASVASAI